MNIYYTNEFQRIFGTWELRGDALVRAVSSALEIGYRAFDTAQMYDNEAALGKALESSGLAREKLCITTKITPANYGTGNFRASLERSLSDLRLDYVDVLLLHWPPADGNIAQPLRLLESAMHDGLARNIGVSNFTSRMLRQTGSIIDTPLVTDQVEFHPLLNQDVLMAAASETGIPLSAYCSVARGKIFSYPELASIGEGYGKSTAQVALRWILQKGVIPVAMSSNPVNMKANFAITDFTLSHVDMHRIDRLTKTNHRIVTHEIVPTAPEWD